MNPEPETLSVTIPTDAPYAGYVIRLAPAPWASLTLGPIPARSVLAEARTQAWMDRTLAALGERFPGVQASLDLETALTHGEAEGELHAPADAAPFAYTIAGPEPQTCREMSDALRASQKVALDRGGLIAAAEADFGRVAGRELLVKQVAVLEGPRGAAETVNLNRPMRVRALAAENFVENRETYCWTCEPGIMESDWPVEMVDRAEDFPELAGREIWACNGPSYLVTGEVKESSLVDVSGLALPAPRPFVAENRNFTLSVEIAADPYWQGRPALVLREQGRPDFSVPFYPTTETWMTPTTPEPCFIVPEQGRNGGWNEVLLETGALAVSDGLLHGMTDHQWHRFKLVDPALLADWRQVSVAHAARTDVTASAATEDYRQSQADLIAAGRAAGGGSDADVPAPERTSVRYDDPIVRFDGHECLLRFERGTPGATPDMILLRDRVSGDTVLRVDNESSLVTPGVAPGHIIVNWLLSDALRQSGAFAAVTPGTDDPDRPELMILLPALRQQWIEAQARASAEIAGVVSRADVIFPWADDQSGPFMAIYVERPSASLSRPDDLDFERVAIFDWLDARMDREGVSLGARFVADLQRAGESVLTLCRHSHEDLPYVYSSRPDMKRLASAAREAEGLAAEEEGVSATT